MSQAKPRISADQLRSARWFGPDDLRSFGHRSRMMQLGYSEEDYVGRPIIGILNTWSEMNTCHSHFRERAKDVKRGIALAGGLGLEMPALSVDESYIKPTSMLLRNLLAMETEEQIRSHPLDGVVLMGGCDKTTPALVMGAISAGVPFIFLPAGPMLRGHFQGNILGSGSDAWKFWDERRAGNISDEQWQGLQGGIARSAGTCMTMGTASTMTAIAEAMGLSLPGASSIPAPDSAHQRMSADCGRRIVEMVWTQQTPDQIITQKAVENATTVALATGCSTNATVHLLAMARRAKVDLTLEQIDERGRHTPLLANIRPSGSTYVMEDFYMAGGLRALMKNLGPMLHQDCMTVSGRTVGENIADAQVFNDDVIRSLDNPLYKNGSIAVLKGNLCPDGAVMKPAACDPKFHQHEGPALVFDSYAEMKAAVEDESLDVTADHVMILRNAGPQGGPGFPEWGMLPIPTKLVKQGVRDMLRISDARMSGTSYGACVLHVTPEAFVGGNLALVRNGDLVRVDVAGRRLDVLISDEELLQRRNAWTAPAPRYERGYGWLYQRHVAQANEGCDFDFLTDSFGKTAGEPDIY